MVKKNEIIADLGKIPEGSQFEKYLKELEEICSVEVNKNTPDLFEKFLKQVFQDCVKFVLPKSPRLSIRVVLIYNNAEFLRLQKEAAERAINVEVATAPSTAFVLDNGINSVIHVNIYRILQSNNKPSIITILADSIIHELLHIGFPQKSEQEIFDMESTSVEKFLGIDLPKEFKDLKASDYYEVKRPN